MERSGSERLMMAFDMFDTARALARANLRSERFSEREIPAQLFLRFYGSDFDKDTLSRIVEALTSRVQGSR
jgi:hypothetical protein